MKSHQTIQSLKDIAGEFRAESEQRAQDLRSRRMVRWEEVLGDALAPLLQSPNEALSQASQETGIVKRVAIEVLSYHWDMADDAAHIAMLSEVISSDSDDDAREASILSVGSIFRRKHHAEWLSTFAQLVTNVGESNRIRRAAYAAMCAITGNAVPYFPSRKQNGTGLLQFPDDVDWDFVASCLTTTRPMKGSLSSGLKVRLSPWELEGLMDGGESVPQLSFNEDVTIQSCSELLTKNPTWAAYSIRGRLQMRAGNWEQAIDDANHALAINSKAFEPLLTRALAYLANGKIENARVDIDEYRKCLKNAIQPNSPP
jgi:tetratricopeptide (TPR) repeat protein